MEPEPLNIEEYHSQETGKLLIRTYRNSKGQYHRLDGPAYERFDDKGENHIYYIWVKNGITHRIGGPAIWIHPDHKNIFVQGPRYYIEGVHYTPEQYKDYFKGIDSKEEQELLVDLGASFD